MPVHLRLNDKDTSRNPYINFVTALPGPRQDEALHRLQQLSAMVKPLMQQECFHINSLEEFEWNREFAGRCWNNGEVVELVLTNSKGEWIPLQFVLFVFCHELAHIKHMNHIPKLHGALTRKLKELALEKQRQGYYGDGMWSSGRQLNNGGFVSGLGMQRGQFDLPEHVCGGAFSKRRIGGGKRRRRGKNGKKRKFQGPSLHTGAQTAPNTKGGNRRVNLDVSNELGNRVDGRDWIPTASAKDSSYKKDENSTFRKRTQTKDARERRANAALARFAILTSPAVKDEEKKMMNGKGTLDSIFKQTSKAESGNASNSVKGELMLSDTSDEESETESEGDEEGEEEDDSVYVGNDLPSSEEPPHFTQASNESDEKRKRRMERFHSLQEQGDGDEWDNLLRDNDEIKKDVETSKAEKETIDISDSSSEDEDEDDDDVVLVEQVPSKKAKRETHGKEEENERQVSKSTWTCLLCTLENDHSNLRCAACEAKKGQITTGT